MKQEKRTVRFVRTCKRLQRAIEVQDFLNDVPLQVSEVKLQLAIEELKASRQGDPSAVMRSARKVFCFSVAENYSFSEPLMKVEAEGIADEEFEAKLEMALDSKRWLLLEE